jgi:hypothetical protein
MTKVADLSYLCQITDYAKNPANVAYPSHES